MLYSFIRSILRQLIWYLNKSSEQSTVSAFYKYVGLNCGGGGGGVDCDKMAMYIYLIFISIFIVSNLHNSVILML